MKNTILLDATMRLESRTKKLAYLYLEASGCKGCMTLPLASVRLQLTPQEMQKRLKLVAKQNYDDPMFDLAKAFAAADEIVIAAPMFDLSFPASLKAYLEAVNVPGIVFEYDESGRCVPKTNIKRVVYITTSGGPITNDEFGYGYIKQFFHTFCGVEDVAYIKAEGLDAFPEEAEVRINKAKEDIRRLIEK